MKTPKDIREAVDLGLHMNLDNELEVRAKAKDIDNMFTPTPTLDKYCCCLPG